MRDENGGKKEGECGETQRERERERETERKRERERERKRERKRHINRKFEVNRFEFYEVF